MTTTDRKQEAEEVKRYLDACYSGLGGKYFCARLHGECALTRVQIRPYQQIGQVGTDAFVRREAADYISIRGNETVDDVLARFGWANPDLASEWVADGAAVILVTKTNLKTRVVRAKRQLNSYLLSDITPLYWRSVAFMLRRDS